MSRKYQELCVYRHCERSAAISDSECEIVSSKTLRNDSKGDHLAVKRVTPKYLNIVLGVSRKMSL